MLFKIDDVLKNLANFTGKHLRWGLFLIKLQAFMHIFEIRKIFKSTFSYTTLSVAASTVYKPDIFKWQ